MVKPYRIPRGEAKYCSVNCYWMALREVSAAVVIAQRACTRCGVTKSVADFYSTYSKLRIKRPLSWCKACVCAFRRVRQRELSLPADIHDRLRAGMCVSETGCWEWLGVIHPHGYGSITVIGRVSLVHRVSYAAFIGPLIPGLQVDHLCANRRCINPNHLEQVTAAINTRRAVARRRNAAALSIQCS
jgi:hypothetical protein